MKTTDFRETNLKATNLMIGDWLYAIDDNGETHPCRVNNLEYDYTNKRDEFSLDFYGTGYKPVWPDVAFKVEPIPITSKILEENGWKLISNTRNKLEYSWSTGAIEEYADIHIYVGKDHSNIWRWDFPILNIHLYRGDIELTKFRYVHELQHALKLCGIDMEITL